MYTVCLYILFMLYDLNHNFEVEKLHYFKPKFGFALLHWMDVWIVKNLYMFYELRKLSKVLFYANFVSYRFTVWFRFHMNSPMISQWCCLILSHVFCRSTGFSEVIVVVGGCERVGGFNLPYTECYDPVTGEWKSLAKHPEYTKSEYAVCALRNDILVSGETLSCNTPRSCWKNT